jgi:hypothetical protein
MANELEKLMRGTIMPNDTFVNQMFAGYVKISEKLRSSHVCSSLIDKLEDWTSNLPGNNYLERIRVLNASFSR